MNWTIIKSEEEYQRALKRLEELFFSEEGSAEFEECDVLSLLVEKYENEHHAVDTSGLDPVTFLKIRMVDLGLKQQDIAMTIGSASRTSEILNRKRKLTLDNIRSLNEKFGFPLEVMVKDYSLDQATTSSVKKI